MSSNQSGILHRQAAALTASRAHWLLFLVEGIVLLGLGLLTVVFPTIATALIEIIGWLLLVSGVVGLIDSFAVQRASGFPWAQLSAILESAAGIVLLRSPLSGTLTLALVFVVFFVVEASLRYCSHSNAQAPALKPAALRADSIVR